MGTYRTELTHGLHVLIQRQCALAASWVATLSQLQPTDDENAMVEILAEIAAHVQLITARGYITMTEVSVAYVRVCTRTGGIYRPYCPALSAVCFSDLYAP